MERLHHLRDGAVSENRGLVMTGLFSVVLHVVLLAFLSYGPRPVVSVSIPYVYRVSIRPLSPRGDGIPKGILHPAPSGPSQEISTVAAGEKWRHSGDPKSKEPVEGLKSRSKKTEPKAERSKKDELEKEKGSRKSLQDALEEIRKKVALDEIQKKVAHREKTGKVTIGGDSKGISSSKNPTQPDSEYGTESGPGTEGGPGTGTGPWIPGAPTGDSTGGSLWGSSVLDSRLSLYYSTVWAKVKEEWTLPENLPKRKIDLETVIVVVIGRDGRIQKSWVEKRSGNTLYDQRAMRAIKKAEPFPPIPKEFSTPTLEVGFRFHPE